MYILYEKIIFYTYLYDRSQLTGYHIDRSHFLECVIGDDKFVGGVPGPLQNVNNENIMGYVSFIGLIDITEEMIYDRYGFLFLMHKMT